MSDKKALENAAVLANATQLSVNVIKKVAGNEISDTVQGSQLNEFLAEAVVAKLNASLERYKKGGAK